MAVNNNTIANVLLARNEIDRYLAIIENDLARMWRVAWNEAADEFALAIQELIDIGNGDWPTRSQVLRAQRAQNALKAAAGALGAIVPRAEASALTQLRGILSSAEYWAERVARSQMPSGVSVGWARVDANAVNAIVLRVTSRIHALHRPLSREMETAMKAVLVRGTFLGENPNAAARQIMQRCMQTFDGGRARAAAIARTELLDAHRAAARQARLANKDLIKGWKWHTTLSARTCPACLSQAGTEHAPDEPGPLGHQQCRCTAVPLTKSWRELGYNMDEPHDEFPSARAWFREQPRATQLRIMGKERLRQLNSGDLKWQDLSTRVDNPHWRPSYQVTPLTGGK